MMDRLLATHAVKKLIVLALCVSGWAYPSDCLADLTLEGRVQDADGAAFAGARVELQKLSTGFEDGERLLHGLPEPPNASTRTDRHGLFRLAVSSPGVFQVRVSAEGSVTMLYMPVILSQGHTLPPVTLRPDLETSVQVVDAQHRPIPDAWVFVENAEGSVWGGDLTRGWMPDFRRRRTDAEGRAKLARGQGERLLLRAIHPTIGISPLHRPPKTLEASAPSDLLASTDPRELVIHSLPSQPARVHLLSGQAEARVLARLGSAAWPVAISNPDGMLRLPLSPAGNDVLLMTKDGRRLKHGGLKLPQGAQEPSEGLSLVFPSVEHLSGRVVDRESGEPLPNALVWSGMAPALGRLTDSAGRYRLVAPSTGRFWLQAEAPGRRSQRLWVDRDNPSPTFSLPKAVSIRGNIVDELGRAVDHAMFEARPPRRGPNGPFFPGRIEKAALSRSNGNYEIQGLEAGEWYEVRISRPGFHPLSIRMGAPADAATPTFVEAVLTSSRRAFGRVVNLDEQPIAGAEVILSHRDQGSVPLPSRRPMAQTGLNAANPKSAAGERRAFTDRDGRFSIDGVLGRAVDLTVYSPAHARSRVRDLLLDDSAATDLGTLLMPPGAVIEGRVVTTDGQPIAGVSIYTSLESQAAALSDWRELSQLEADVVTDSDGRFTVSGFLDGDRVQWVALSPGFTPAWQKGVDAPTELEVILELERAPLLTGQVRDPDGGTVPGAEIRITSSQPLAGSEGRLELGRSFHYQTVSDQTGRFEVPDIRAGVLSITAQAGDLVSSQPLKVEIPASDEPIEIELTLSRGASASGWVLDSEGRAIPDVHISLEGQSTPTEASTRSDREGYFELSGLVPGGVLLTASHPDYVRIRRDLNVGTEPATVELVLDGGLTLVGRVLDRDGLGIHAARVELITQGPQTRPPYVSGSATDGMFKIPSVAPGRYWIRAFHESYAENTEPQAIELKTSTSDISLVLDQSITVSGQIFGLDFDELAAVEVTAASRERSPRSARVSYDGNFEIEGLGPGSWLLEAVLPAGRRKAQARFLVEPHSSEVRQNLEFKSALTLSGTVRSNGQTLDDTRVTLAGLDFDVHRAVSTDHQGRFRFEDLEPGQYRLGAMHTRDMLVSNRRIDLRTDRALDLDLRASRVRGRVVDSRSGEGLSETTLVLRRLLDAPDAQEFIISDASGDHGQFTMPRVPPGAYRFEVSRSGFLRAERELEVHPEQDIEGLELALEKTPGVHLRVRLASGQIPPYVYVSSLDNSGRPGPPESATVKSDGHVHLSSTPTDSSVLLISAPGAALTQVQLTTPGSEPEPPWISLDPAGQMLVRVPALSASDRLATLELFDPSGRPLRSLSSSGGFQSSWQFAGGQVEISGVPAGHWNLTITTAQGDQLTRPVATTGQGRAEALLQ